MTMTDEGFVAAIAAIRRQMPRNGPVMEVLAEAERRLVLNRQPPATEPAKSRKGAPSPKAEKKETKWRR